MDVLWHDRHSLAQPPTTPTTRPLPRAQYSSRASSRTQLVAARGAGLVRFGEPDPLRGRSAAPASISVKETRCGTYPAQARAPTGSAGGNAMSTARCCRFARIECRLIKEIGGCGGNVRIVWCDLMEANSERMAAVLDYFGRSLFMPVCPVGDGMNWPRCPWYAPADS